MKSSSSKMALKPYLEAVRVHCEGLSKEELTACFLNLAQEVPVGGRGDFLDKIRAFSSNSASGVSSTAANLGESLLDSIAGLREEIEERIASIEDGSYWDDRADWEDHDYDEEPDSVTEEQSEELEHLFLETGGIFLDGQLALARRLYHELFTLLGSDMEIYPGPSLWGLDLREARAKYSRCVYETSEPARRVADFLQSMSVDARINTQRLDLTSEHFPMLQDVVDAAPSDLPGWETFLPAWEKQLACQDGPRAAVLRMEAVRHLEGVSGLSRLAREWKLDQPRGYLLWIQCLEEDGDWQGMRDASLEALKELPPDGFREQVAGYLTKAAVELGDTKAVLMGKREKFLSFPNEGNLTGFLDEADKQGSRSHELKAVLAFRELIEGGDRRRKNLYLKMLLIAGNLDDAFSLAKDEASLGWSLGTAGVLFSAVLSVLTANSEKAVLVKGLLKEYAARSYSFFEDSVGEDGDRICNEILKGLTAVNLTPQDIRKYGEWVDMTGRNRVEEIVSNKHRGAYDRAARALGALAEYYVLSSGKDRAKLLLNEFVKVKFSRHSAFRSEVKAFVGEAPLLRDLKVQ